MSVIKVFVYSTNKKKITPGQEELLSDNLKIDIHDTDKTFLFRGLETEQDLETKHWNVLLYIECSSSYDKDDLDKRGKEIADNYNNERVDKITLEYERTLNYKGSKYPLIKKKTSSKKKNVKGYTFGYPAHRYFGQGQDYSVTFNVTIYDKNKKVKRDLDDYEYQIIREELFDSLYDKIPEYIATMSVKYQEEKDNNTFVVFGITSRSRSEAEGFIINNVAGSGNSVEINENDDNEITEIVLTEVEKGKDEKKTTSKKEKVVKKKSSSKKEKKESKLPEIDREFGLVVEYKIDIKFGIAEKKKGKLVQLEEITKDERRIIKEFINSPSYDSHFVIHEINEGIIHIVGEIESQLGLDENEILKEVENLLKRPIKMGKRELYLF